ncbi:MAG TPA: molybdopterin cofactor-binding domain-containing protein, partial [Hymenobacter sp.]
RNHADTDPERSRPFSSKFLKDAYTLGAERIGWKLRNPAIGATKEGDWLVGYGMGTGMFNASRGTAKASAKLFADGTLVMQSAVADSGPGTATAMTAIASQRLGLAPKNITFELGDSSLPPGPTQGGSTTTSTLGSAVYALAESLKSKLAELAKENAVFHTEQIHTAKPEDFVFENGTIALASDRSKKLSYAQVLKAAGLHQLEITEESKGAEVMKNYSAYSYSVHFVKVLVNPLTGVVRIARIVTAADAGTIVSPRQAESQMIGGAVGGIGMALMEEGIIDHRYGRWVNNNFADYHVPVHADVPPIECLFVNKPDPYLNPMGSKGMGEIALIGFAAAVANAVYHATGKRIRSLPITPDKVLA